MQFEKIMVLVFLFSIYFAGAQEYSIDVSIGQQEAHSIGDNLVFIVRLLENNIPINQNVDVLFSDALGRKQISKKVVSNEESFLLIEEDFPSGYWNVEVSYNGKIGKGIFSVKEKTGVEFVIEDDKLIIRNIGNVRYIKTVQIVIGDEVQTISPNIKVGGQKELRLIAPEGNYDIKVSDGENTMTRKNVQLFGTGNVVGAIDEDLVGYAGLGGASDPNNLEENFFSLDRLPVALVFIGAVFALGILLLVERKFRKVEKN